MMACSRALRALFMNTLSSCFTNSTANSRSDLSPILITMASIVDEARLKLNRGKEHFYMLELETRKFWDTEPYILVHERNGEEFPNLLRFKLVQPIPQHRWGLILGDAVHNTRSALDYIVWRLAGSHLDDRTSQFPIYRSEDDWNSRMQWRFRQRPIHPDALAYIKTLQPYTRPDPKRAVLWLLQELDARDKHKLVTMTQSVTRGARFAGVGQMLIPYATIEREIEDGTVIVEYADPPEACVNMELDFAFSIKFKRGLISETEDFDVGKCLDNIFKAVEAIISNFELRPDWFP